MGLLKSACLYFLQLGLDAVVDSDDDAAEKKELQMLM